MIGNAFALMSTDPKRLYAVHDPVGPENDRALENMAKKAGLVVCGWGTHGNLLCRGDSLLESLRAIPVKLHCFGQNKDGTPKHQLYIGYKTTFLEF